MGNRRAALSLLLSAALLGGALPAIAAGRPAGAHSASVGRRAAPIRNDEVTLTRGVAAPGDYTVHITITSRVRHAMRVRVLVGSVWRSARTGAHRHSVRLTIPLAVSGRTVTVRARSHRTRPGITVRITPAHTRHQSAKPAQSAAASVVQPAAPTPPPPPAPAPAPAPPSPPAPTTPWPGGAVALPAGFAPVANYSTLVKDYSFSGSSLPSDWTAGSGNYGFQATNFAPSQVSMSGGAANLTATNQPSGGKPNTGGWISTKGHYTLTHGLIDFRAKMPAGQGLWSGLWLDQPDGSNPWGEIDVQEMLLDNTQRVFGSLHGWAPGPLWHVTQYGTMSWDATQDYHDYQVIWQPGLFTWAVDGVAYAQYTSAQAAAAGYSWPFDTQTGTYLIADLAVGGPNDWPGAPNALTTFPASMQVQSVRVWQ